MNAFNLSFTPQVSILLIVALGIAGLIAVALAVVARRPAAWLRALALLALLVALADPSFVREERDPLNDIVAVVLDRSASQTIGDRRAQTDAAKEIIENRLAALGNVETRVIESNRSDADNDGTRLFATLQSGLADVPPERLGGVIMVTDGVVHDIPESVDHLGFRAPLHVLVTGPRRRA